MGYKPITSKDPHSKYLKDLFKRKFASTSIRSLKYDHETDTYSAKVFFDWDGSRYKTYSYAKIEGKFARQYYKDNIADGFFSIHA
jgi:hypothetical protein|tara:strand:- start:313 stop:567 length:255 start_codon:yes stop_codon:yes gene_type:complete